MAEAFFITGFNNWGKTTIVNVLFNWTRRFWLGRDYGIDGINGRFTVQSQSNDDLGPGWIGHIIRRQNAETVPNLHLVSAFCPAEDFVQLLGNPCFARYQTLHVFLLEFKYDQHAQLLVENIISATAGNTRIRYHLIGADRGMVGNSHVQKDARRDLKVAQIRGILAGLLP